MRVSIPQFLLNYTHITLFRKSHRFGKCSHLIFLYIIGYNNISWRPHDTHDSQSQNLGMRHLKTPIPDAYMICMSVLLSLSPYLSVPLSTSVSGCLYVSLSVCHCLSVSLSPMQICGFFGLNIYNIAINITFSGAVDHCCPHEIAFH